MKRLTKLLAKLCTIVVSAAMVLPMMNAVPVHAASDIPIDANHFPDANFRAIIATKTYDKDLNGYLSQYEIERIYNLHCENSNIYSIKGVEYLTYIQGLWCLGNHISSWDLSKNKNLVGIWCSQNDFTSLDFSMCPNLQWVYCFNCKLTSLNLKGNPEMAYVECNANPNLKSLDLSKNSKLENLFCSDCSLTSLNVSGCPLLCELACFNNQLTSLNLSNNKLLKRLDCWNNPNLGYVDVSMLTELNYFNCAKTGTTRVDVTHNTKLQWLVCSYNDQLKTLDLSKNPELASLHLDCNWRMTSLDLSKNPKLYYLQAFGLRSLDKLDISNNSRLIKAYKQGVYEACPKISNDVHSYTLKYGGSGDPLDNLLHCLVVDDDMPIITTGRVTADVPDSIIDTNDGHSGSETFATRAQAIQLLYELAGSPAVSGTSRFTDVSAYANYAKAVKWGQDNNICFGYPNICDDKFCPNELISRQDFALMAHRFAGIKKFGTAMDYGRTDWFDDYDQIDYYAWVPFTWAIQFNVLTTFEGVNMCYPHGRMTVAELNYGANKIFNLDGAASYSAIVNGNGTPGQGGTVYTPPTSSGSGSSSSGSSSSGSSTTVPGSGSWSGSTPTGSSSSTTSTVNSGVPKAPHTYTGSGASINYTTHVQNEGWQRYVYNGDMSGTEGKSLRLEGIAINIEAPFDLGVRYRTHVENIGWQNWVSDGQLAGTSGKSLRLEAIQIELTGAAKDHYDIYYRVHVENIGWQGWVKNGATSGTSGYGLRLEAIQIKLVPKGHPTNNVTYNTHVQNLGWQASVADGLTAGTTGKSLRLEGIHITANSAIGLGVQYRTHVQNIGWQKWVSDGQMAGTSGYSLRLEAIEIKLTGVNADKYDIYYRTHVENFGWTDWACNGQPCGSAGFGYRLEGIKIIVVPKGAPAPGSTAKPYYQR